MAPVRATFSEQSNHAVEESSGNGLLKPEIVPRTTCFQGTSSPAEGLYTERFMGASTATTNTPSDRDLRKQGKKYKKLSVYT